MSNIIDSIQLSGTTYQIQGSGGGGNPTVELTQAEYDALVSAGTVSANTYYIITDATAGDLTNYYTKSETNTLLNGKQATVQSGTNIKTINNESILGSGNIDIQGGGGKAIEAGRGISITTGATADTVSFSLPISAGTGTNSIREGNAIFASGNYSHAEGSDTSANGNYSHAEGYMTTANTWYSHSEGERTYSKGNASHTEGSYTVAENNSEHASGQYNVSSKASNTFGDSGNTLFSVGNGTANNAKHNAFEIRQNGDIYITSGGTDIKLQDNLGGGGGGTTYSAGTDIDITNDVISVKQISGDSAFVDVTSTLENETSVAINTSAIIATMKEDAVANGVSFYDNNGHFLAVENNGSGLDVLGNTSYFNYSTDGYSITASTLASGDTFISISNDSGNQLEWLVEYFAILATTYSLQDFADNVYGKFSGYVATSAVTSSVTSSSTDVITSGGVYAQLGGLKLQQITQADYDDLVSGGTVDASTLYIITNVVN